MRRDGGVRKGGEGQRHEGVGKVKQGRMDVMTQIGEGEVRRVEEEEEVILFL